MNRSKILENAYDSASTFGNYLSELVTRESPTHDKAACDALADHLEAVMKRDGFTVTRHERAEVGDVMEGRLGGTGGPSTLLLTHYDTVWPLGTLEVMPLSEANGIIHGPGVLDMKGGIASAFTALGIARELNLPLTGDVTLLLTSDEETGSHHSRALIEELAESHDRVFVLEPARDDGALKVGRKGVGDFELHLSGRSAHAGNNPADGASALRELAHLLLYVEDLADEVAGTTVNVTMAKAGFAGNVIAEAADAYVDMRVLKQGEAERVIDAIRSYTPRDKRVTLTVSGGLNRPPLERTAANEALFDQALAVGAELGIELSGAVVGGGSDGNFTSALGVATLDGLGAVGSGPHARHEQIKLRPTLERVALLAALLTAP